MALRTSLVSAELVRSKGAAASLALLYRRKVFLILRYDHTWAFPGGSLEEGEKSLPGALREFVEEVGSPAPLRNPNGSNGLYKPWKKAHPLDCHDTRTPSGS